MIRRMPLLLLLACGSPQAPNGDVALRADVVLDLAVHVALGNYQDFASQTAQLSEATVALCSAPDAAGLTAARDAWSLSRQPWKRAEVVQFGPIVEYPERLGPKVDDWPVNADAVESLVVGNAPVQADDFTVMGSATRGLPVIEYLLWSGDDVLTQLSGDPRRCQVLVGASADVQLSAEQMVQAWRQTWVPLVGQPSLLADDTYNTVQDSLDEWVNRVAFTVENIRAEKLGKPLGDSSGGEPQPDTLESRLSERSLGDARDALDGARDVWEAGIREEHLGLRDLVTDDSTRTHIDQLFAISAQRLAEIPEPLEETVVLQPEIVSVAQASLLALQVGIQVELAQTLGVTLAFNDNDGD